MNVLRKILNWLFKKETKPVSDISAGIALAISTMKAADDKIASLTALEGQAAQTAADLVAANTTIATMQAKEDDLTAQLAAATDALAAAVNPAPTPSPAADPAAA